MIDKGGERMTLHGIKMLDERLSTLSRKHISTDKETRLALMIPLITELFEQIDSLKRVDKAPTETYEELYQIIGKWVDYLAYHGIVIKEPILPLRDNTEYMPTQKPQENQEIRPNRKRYVGKVIRISGAKTIAVEYTTLYEHPVYKKKLKRKKVFLVHDENEMACVGDIVEIMESRPMSKTKHHVLIRVLHHRPNYGTKAHPAHMFGSADKMCRF